MCSIKPIGEIEQSDYIKTIHRLTPIKKFLFHSCRLIPGSSTLQKEENETWCIDYPIESRLVLIWQTEDKKYTIKEVFHTFNLCKAKYSKEEIHMLLLSRTQRDDSLGFYMKDETDEKGLKWHVDYLEYGGTEVNYETQGQKKNSPQEESTKEESGEESSGDMGQ